MCLCFLWIMFSAKLDWEPDETMNRNELLELKDRMEQEHRKDKEALARLLRFLPQEEPEPQETLRLSFGQATAGQLSQTTGKLTKMDLKILQILQHDPDNERNWTVREMLPRIELLGIRLPAVKPEARINKSIRNLVAQGYVTVVLEPQGRRPGIYRYRADPPPQKRIAS